jgi:hypothetical protein
VGGFVSRGRALSDPEGRYVFGDFSGSFQTPSGRVWFATPRTAGLWDFDLLPFGDRGAGMLGHYLKGLGEDRQGELYLLTSDQGGPTGSSGRVYRLAPHSP